MPGSSTILITEALLCRASDAIGLAFGGLNHEVDATVVSEDLVQLEGEGVTLTHDGGAGRILHARERRRNNHQLAAASDNPVVQAGEQVRPRNLGAGAQDAAALLGKREFVPGKDLLIGERLPHRGQALENTLDLGLVRGPDGTAISAVADVLAILHLGCGHALGAAAHLLEGDGRNVLHSQKSLSL